MKITFVLPDYCLKPVGGAKVVYQYANQLVSRGHAVSVIHPRFMRNVKYPKKNWFMSQASKVYRSIYRPKKRSWQAIDDRVKMTYVREPVPGNIPDADFVIATAWSTAEYVKDYAGSKGRKLYLIQHYEIWDGPADRVADTWRAPLKKIVIAKWLYEKGLELGVDRNDMAYIPNGIDHGIFRVINGIENRPGRIAMMYHTAEWKGSSDGIRAIELAREQVPNVQAVLFGRFKRPVSIPGWIEYRYFPGETELIEGIYNKAGIFICSSWTEGAPAPPAEAMACGCALVSTSCTGIDEYAEDGTTALLSPPKDPESMAKNLIRLLKDDRLRVRIATAGVEHIKRFTWKRAADQLEKLMQEEAGK